MTVSRRTLGRAAIGLAAAAAFWFSLRESAETRALRVIERLARALRRRSGQSVAEWRRTLEQLASEELASTARVSVPELGTLEGRAEVLATALASGGVFEIELEPSGVQLDDRRANVRLTLSIVAHVPGAERRESRSASVVLQREQRSFRLLSLEIDRALREEPEARP